MKPDLPPSRFQNLELAIFRLFNCCAVIQEGMGGYYQTAGLEKIAQIDYIFNWLKKRSVSICLISDFSEKDTEVILSRLGWSPDAIDNPIDAVVLREGFPAAQLYAEAARRCSLSDCSSSIALADQTALLEGAWANNCLYTIGLNYGQTPARELAQASHHALFDSIIELPNFISQVLPLVQPKPQFRFKSPRAAALLF